MNTARNLLQDLGLPTGDRYDLPSSALRFPDGAHYRVEIPSVEGPEAFRAVIDTAASLGVTIHRVSQGSGIMLLSDAELRHGSTRPRTRYRSLVIHRAARGLGRHSTVTYARWEAARLATYWHGSTRLRLQRCRTGSELRCARRFIRRRGANVAARPSARTWSFARRFGCQRLGTAWCSQPDRHQIDGRSRVEYNQCRL